MISLGEVVDIRGGGTPSRAIPEYWGGAIPWASVKDFKSTIIESTEDCITELGVKNSATNVIPAGSIVVPTRMAVGKVAVLAVDMAINQDLKALIVKDEKVLDKRYLLRFLESQSNNVLKHAKGATVKGITLDVLRGLEIPLPPLTEQKRIAAILDKADAIRRKRQQAIQLADEFLRSVFLDMFGDPVTNPKGWDVVELGELVESSDRLNYGVVQPGEDVSEGVPLVRSGDLSDDAPKLDSLRRVSKSIDHKHRKSRLKGNEILIACVGSIGRVGWVTKNMVGWNIARAVIRIPVRQGVNREYLYRYLQNPVVQGYFERETRAGAQPTLNVSLIAKTPIALPPVGLQMEFLKKYERATALKKKYLKAMNSQGNIFSALSQKSFSGEL